MPGIPILWQLAAIGVVLLLGVGGIGGLYAYVWHHGYDNAAAKCHEAEIHAQLDAANRDLDIARHAADLANKQSIEIADEAADLQAKVNAYEAELAKADPGHPGCVLDDDDVERLRPFFR